MPTSKRDTGRASRASESSSIIRQLTASLTPKLPSIPYPILFQETPEPKRPRDNLFESLLGGSAEHLHVDLEEHPGRYEHLDQEQLKSLLDGLVERTKKRDELTEEELELLSRATAEFATSPRTPQLEEGREKIETALKRLVTQPAKLEEPEYTIGAPRHDEIPDTDLPPFWWV